MSCRTLTGRRRSSPVPPVVSATRSRGRSPVRAQRSCCPTSGRRLRRGDGRDRRRCVCVRVRRHRRITSPGARAACGRVPRRARLDGLVRWGRQRRPDRGDVADGVASGARGRPRRRVPVHETRGRGDGSGRRWDDHQHRLDQGIRRLARDRSLRRCQGRRRLAVEDRRDRDASVNVRVNAICPGWVQTDMVAGNRDALEALLPMTFDEYIGHIQGRLGEPAEIADIAVFLASERSRFSSGSAYVVDGGATASLV